MKLESFLLCGSIADDVEANSQGDDQTNDNLLPERRHIEQVQPIADYSQQQCTDERSGRAALTAS